MSLRQYALLMRLDKPIGIFLLLWPTSWALWLAACGMPDLTLLSIFVAGVVLMRSAGCIVNDICDRDVDRHVTRTLQRPLAAGALSVKQALALLFLLALTAFLLVLQCNLLTVLLAIAGAVLTVMYPLLKRVTHLPQVGLGIVFSWGVPMSFAAVMGYVPKAAWLVYAAAGLWSVIYDTMYAMTDRDDDLKIGVKSTAILFGKNDVFILAVLTVLFVIMLALTGILFQLSVVYYVFLSGAVYVLIYNLILIRDRLPGRCFQAFKNNNLAGLFIFMGILIGTWQGN